MATRERVYEAAGRALEAANLLETELGTLLLILDALETGSHVNPDRDAYLRLRDAIDRKTLGQSLAAVRKRLKIDGDIDRVFNDALEARNKIAHRFFPGHGLRIIDTNGCATMLKEATELRHTLWDGYTAAQRLTERLFPLLNAVRGAPK